MAWREDCDLGVVRIRELTVASGVTGDVTGDVTGAITVPTYAVADLPTAADSTRMLVLCSDGASGSPCLAFCNGTNWLQVALGSAVSAT